MLRLQRWSRPTGRRRILWNVEKLWPSNFWKCFEVYRCHSTWRKRQKLRNLGCSNDKMFFVFSKQLKCCGVNNASDWASFPWEKTHPGQVPMSCCKDQSGSTCSLSSPSNVYIQVTERGQWNLEIVKNSDLMFICKQGCYQQLKLALEKSMVIVAGVGIGVAFIQVCRSQTKWSPL